MGKFFFLAGLFLFTGCFEPAGPAPPPALKPDSSGSPRNRKQESSITIIAAGDNLIHDIIYNSARTDRGFNFDPSYGHIKSIVESADIAFVNQETVLGGEQFGYSGYPVFNTPQDTGIGLINAGFDVVNHASNHAMDRGERAVYGTMDFWDTHPEILYLGIFRTEAQRKTEKRIIEKNGITTGFLSYTYGLNGFVLPQDKPWLVGMIDRDVMAREIDELRPLCDLLVVSMHWGDEFQHRVSETQRELARFMAERQVDLIIGHHPHVTQGVEIIPRADGGVLTCYYSLGDLLSHTQSDWTPDTITGALAYIRVKKTWTGPAADTPAGSSPGAATITVDRAQVIPTVCHYGAERGSPFIVYPLWDYTDELAALHYKKKVTVEYLYRLAWDTFGLRVLEKTTPR